LDKRKFLIGRLEPNIGVIVLNNDQLIQIDFCKLGHFWFDVGLAGLIIMLEETKTNDIEVKVIENKLTLNGKAEDIEAVLEKTYDLLIERYYNLSTKKQKEDPTSYNFYYDSNDDKFIAFPKRKSVGIASIIADTAPRPTGDLVKWKSKIEKTIMFNGKSIKKNRGILPEEYAHLQERMENFLDQNGLDVTTSGLLIDGPNAIKPKIRIKISEKKKDKHCYLCGEETENIDEANQTIFPFITGTSGVLSFNPEAGKPEKICWKCSLLGKFVPVTGFYSSQGEHLYIFLPYSPSLEKMCDSYNVLQATKHEDPNLYRNFEHPLGGYFQHVFETTFAFLYTLYDKLHLPGNNEDKFNFDMEAMLGLAFNKAPLEFHVIHTCDEGSTFAGKLVWPFKETVYFFKLIQEIEKTIDIGMKEILFYCIDFTQSKIETQTILRNKICERILKKQTILDLVEKHVFHAQLTYFKPLFDMLLVYELLIKEGELVLKEEQEAAVSLGKSIGKAVGERGKMGDLYTLRKCRRKVDFLEQLNRLQFRLGSALYVTKEVYEGKLTDDNFPEFKQFCMIAALNSFNYAEKKTEKGENTK
jgi:hypothetical protein